MVDKSCTEISISSEVKLESKLEVFFLLNQKKYI